MSSESKKWIEAGIILAQNANAKVNCPVCDQEYLQVKDVHWDEDPEHWERYMYCPKCGATNSLLKR